MAELYHSHRISISGLALGGGEPVRIQSMTSTDTGDLNASLSQCERLIAAGAELVRLTTQGRREVESLGKIRKELRGRGLNTPLVADIHFRPALALEAAAVADKIRINPGNYTGGKDPGQLLPALLDRCRRHGTAIRIGVNHGSLEPSIIEEYGDTPEGMVHSAMRFLQLCMEKGFTDVVVSMKASNPVVMISSVRLLAHRMKSAGMSFPIHLGVTEAGDGIEGRIKSAVGMAPLLLEGMGDTLRVSLTEPPENEIPVARSIATLFPRPVELPYPLSGPLAWDPFRFERRNTLAVAGIGGGGPVRIIGNPPPDPGMDLRPADLGGMLVSCRDWDKDPSLPGQGQILMLERGDLSIQQVKARVNRFCRVNRGSPVIYRYKGAETDPETFTIQLAGELGSLLADGCIDGVWVENPAMEPGDLNGLLLDILQASGARISKTEYIACPSCGRTHFDILTRLREVRLATSHLKTLKIAVMGCIVNGPGEMADAHYGYVGAGPGKITLYKGRHPVRRNIPEEEALGALVELIKQEGDWIEP